MSTTYRARKGRKREFSTPGEAEAYDWGWGRFQWGQDVPDGGAALTGYLDAEADYSPEYRNQSSTDDVKED